MLGGDVTAGFLGAFLTGSTKWRAPEDLHRPSRVAVEDTVLNRVVEGASVLRCWSCIRNTTKLRLNRPMSGPVQ